MKRLLRWLRRWWGLLVLAVALVLALYIGLAPVVARWAAVRTLEGIGLEDVQLEVSGVSPSYAEVRNVTVGEEGRLRVAAAGVTYSPSGIAHGRVRTIDLAGAEVVLKLKDGVLDLGPLAGLLAAKGSKKKAKLPFARADLRSSALVLDWEGQRLRIPVRGSVENLGEGKAKLDAHIEVAGTHLRVAVTGDINTLEGEAVIEGRATDLAGLLAAIPPKVAVLPGRAGGPLTFKVTVSSKKEGIEASLIAQVEGAAFATRLGGQSVALSADRITAGGRARLARSLALDALTGEVRATGMRLNGETVQAAALEVKREGREWAFRANASGEDWELKASLPTWPRPAGTPEPCDRISVPASVHAAGILPRAIRRALRRQGVEVESAGRIAVEAALNPQFSRTDKGWLWRIGVPALEATLEPGDVAIGPAGVALHRLAGEARAGGWVDAAGVRAIILPGTRASAGGVAARWPHLEWELASAEEPAVELIGGATLSVPFHDAKPSWEVTAPDVRVAFRRGRLVVPSAGITLGGLAGDLRLTASASSDGAAVRMASGSRVVAGSLNAEASGIQLAAATSGQPILTARPGAKGLDFTAWHKDGKVAWRAEAPEALLQWGEQHASLAGGGVKIDGLSGAIPVKAEAGPDGWKVFPLAGGSLVFRSLETMIGGMRERAGPGLLAIDPESKQPLFHLELTQEGWTVRLAARAKAKGAVDVAVGEGGAVKLGSLRTEAELIHDSEGGIRVKSTSVAEGVEGSLKVPLSGRFLTGTSSGGDLRLAIAGTGRAGEMSKVPWKLDFAAKTGKAQVRAPLSSGDIEASLAQGEWNGSATVGGERRDLDAKAVFRGLAIQHAASGVAASGIDGEVPLTLNCESQAAGRFEVGSVLLGKDKLATLGRLAGTARVADWRADFAAKWPLLKGATLNAEGWVDFGRGVPQGELKATVPRFQIGEDNQPSKLFAAAKGIDVRGAVSLDGRLAGLGDRLDSLVRLTVENAELASKEWDAAAQGVRASITLSSLTPPSTPGNQRIVFKTARVGQLQTQDGLLVFRLEDPHSLLVETARWAWAGGHLYTEAFRVDPQAPDIDVAIYGDRLKLGDILALLPDGIAKGEGELYGRLPVRFRWPHLKFSPGFVYATPGSKGWIQIRETPEARKHLEAALKPTVDRIVKEILEREPRYAKEDLRMEIQTRFIDGLENFEYVIFRADFMTVKDALRPVVFLAGQGRTGAQQEFKGVTLEFPVDFDKLLSGAIIGKRGFQHALEEGAKK